MAFENIPLKSISGTVISSLGVSTLLWNNPSGYPVPPGNTPPRAVPRDYTWTLIVDIQSQPHSSISTRAPGIYNGQDVVVGMWIANANTGQAWAITRIDSMTPTQVTMVVRDVYRYNTFRDTSQQGQGGPALGSYIIFNTSDNGLPLIDPVPPGGVSAQFGINLESRFEYINLQSDYPLLVPGNSFIIGDVIAADPANNSFTLADNAHRTVIGRVVSISNILDGSFTINPVQRIADNLDFLPGDVGDTIYTSITNPGEITTEPGGASIYVNIRKNTESVTYSTQPGPTTAGNVFQLNGDNIIVGGTGAINDVIDATNAQSLDTGVVASLELPPTVATTVAANLSPTYGEILLRITPTPASASINGITVTFDIPSANPGYENYSQALQMVQAINNANIPDIIAESPIPQQLIIINTIGGPIDIVNQVPDADFVQFAGPSSGSGIDLLTPAAITSRIKFLAIDARAISFLDVTGNTIADFGLVSVENGIKAAGLYIADGLRAASNTVVIDLAQLNSLTPLIGDQAYVINSDDGQGNNVDEWSMWIFDGIDWVQTSNLDSSTTDAKSLEYNLTTESPAIITIGKISTGRRVTLITVEVTTPFDSEFSTLNIGYIVNNPSSPSTVANGLMNSGLIDLSVVGTYATSTDIRFGSDTEQGDVTLTANYAENGSTTGEAKIIVSYV